jgi:plasmid stability protein
MEKITVKKSDLLEKLEANMADHRQIFEEALAGWERETIAELAVRTREIRAGKKRTVTIHKAIPIDHTADYLRAIEMVKMAVGETVTLTEDDFAQYVMDDWGWQRQFVNNSYGSNRAVGKFGAAFYNSDR